MSKNKAVQQHKFGTFLGVYLPSLLTILGLIMYLRFGWVVGNMGVPMTILIVIMASSITFITGLSASAIATNIKVGVGGEYYLVSRSLGLEPGGAIGIPLYLCRTLSITFYSFGLAEALLMFWPQSWGTPPAHIVQIVAVVVIVLVTLLSGKSAKLVLKAQIPILIFVILSILALAIGVFSHPLRAPEWAPTYRTAPQGFWYVFAVFFPAVTGFTAGIGMSGDLKNPGESIPKGTLGAVVTGAVLYMIIPVLLSITVLLSFDQLADPDLGVGTWTKVAFLGGILVYPAVLGAILSSAFGSVLAGPRVLQALALDGLAPKFLTKLSKSGQPAVATWVSGAIALAAVTLGNLNTIAQYVSVLFLTLYVAINISAAVEELVKEPSYRPKLKVPWYISMLGALGAIWVMYLINPYACIFALVLESAIFIYLKSKSLEQQWGDATSGLWINVARYALLQLNKKKLLSRNWRPFMLLFVSDVKERFQLVKLAAALGQNRGVLTVSKLIFDFGISSEKREEMQMQMLKELHEKNLEAFCEVNPVKDLNEGMLTISASHGLGVMKTNTIVFGWSEEKENQISQLKVIRELSQINKNILLVRFNKNYSSKKKYKQIDLWWGGREKNGDLMLLLAYLLKLNKHWNKAAITIRSAVNTMEEKQKLETGIIKLLPDAKVEISLI
ncbi:MAG TPA: amino acid permease, partial [Bacteroidetes bacterium]|nr:amino acid permease [Bacteroidota bacterium]